MCVLCITYSMVTRRKPNPNLPNPLQKSNLHLSATVNLAQTSQLKQLFSRTAQNAHINYTNSNMLQMHEEPLVSLLNTSIESKCTKRISISQIVIVLRKLTIDDH